MPHILSSSALDLLYKLEVDGRAIPIIDNFDTEIPAGASRTITFDRKTLGKDHAIPDNAVFFMVLQEIINDPLLATIESTFEFLPPVPRLKITRTSRGQTTTLPTVFLPQTKATLILTAPAGISVGVTVTTIIDVIAQEDVQLFVLLGQRLLQQLEEIRATGLTPTVVEPRESIVGSELLSVKET